jgi:hypothetical protein
MIKQWLGGILAVLLFSGIAYAQFIDEFGGSELDQWRFFTGDGEATIDFRPGNGYAKIIVDASGDTRNIWWAVIQRTISDDLDISRLREPEYELRIEARIRVSHAPRRVNLHLHTQKTTDFHTHLMEFDIPDTSNWHTISMTTAGFDAEPGDMVNGQLALMDWGTEKYRVDIDYFKVDLVDLTLAEPDRGEQVPYPPPDLTPGMFLHSIASAQAGMVDTQYPDVNLNGWYATENSERVPVMTVGGSQWIILRWVLTGFSDMQADGHALLELTTYSLQRAETGIHEFGKVRVVEIFGGNPEWNRETVTLTALTAGQPIERVFNTQMVVDIDVTESRGSKTRIVIPRPVIQRMLEGITTGLALRSLGPINASFFPPEGMLYFNVVGSK